LAIYRIFQQRVFEPESLICMAKAYEDALVALQLKNRQDPITEFVAKKIVEIAETGERDPNRLRDPHLIPVPVRGSIRHADCYCRICANATIQSEGRHRWIKPSVSQENCCNFSSMRRPTSVEHSQ
jgi:hypothetical protein